MPAIRPVKSTCAVNRLRPWLTPLVFLGSLGLAYKLLMRNWQMHWGAAARESSAPMAGVDLVPKADYVTTRAITIQEPPDAVWPWLVQLGQGASGSTRTIRLSRCTSLCCKLDIARSSLAAGASHWIAGVPRPLRRLAYERHRFRARASTGRVLRVRSGFLVGHRGAAYLPRDPLFRLQAQSCWTGGGGGTSRFLTIAMLAMTNQLTSVSWPMYVTQPAAV